MEILFLEAGGQIEATPLDLSESNQLFFLDDSGKDDKAKCVFLLEYWCCGHYGHPGKDDHYDQESHHI